MYIFRFFICVLDLLHKFDNYICATYALSIFLVQPRSLSPQSDDITIFQTLHSSTCGNYSPRCIRCIDQALCARNTNQVYFRCLQNLPSETNCSVVCERPLVVYIGERPQVQNEQYFTGPSLLCVLSARYRVPC